MKSIKIANGKEYEIVEYYNNVSPIKKSGGDVDDNI